MTTYRLCLRGPTNRIAKVRRYWANTDEGAVATAREMLSDDPSPIGFELWDGQRKVAEDAKRAGASRLDHNGGRSKRRPPKAVRAATRKTPSDSRGGPQG